MHDHRTGAASARRGTTPCRRAAAAALRRRAATPPRAISQSHDGSLHGCGCVKSGRFIAKRLTIAPRGVVQLDARRQPLGGEAGLRPHQERRVGRRRAGHRRIAGPHQIIERDDAIDLGEGFLQLGVQVLPLVHDLRRVARFDQLPPRALRGIDQRRIQHERRQRDRQERQQQPHRLRAVAIDRADSDASATPPPPRTATTSSDGHCGARSSAASTPKNIDAPAAATARIARTRHGAARDRKHPRRPRQPIEQDRQADHRGIERDQADDHRQARRVEPIEREAHDVDRRLRDMRAQEPLVRHHQRGDAAARRRAGRRRTSAAADGRSTTTDADAGPMRRAPHREARHRQHDQPGDDQRVQEEIERRGERRRCANRRPRRRRQQREIGEPGLANRDPRRSRARRSAAAAIASVRTVAAPPDRVSRRQSSSGPASSSSSSAGERELRGDTGDRECAAARAAGPRRTR